MSRKESEILNEVLERVRSLSKLYIGGAKDIDIDKKIKSGNHTFNSARWILSHLIWTEHFLLIKGVGGEDMGIKWLDEYSYGSNPDEAKTKLSYEELVKLNDEIHDKASDIIKNLSDEQLDEDNFIGANFGGKKSKRAVILHAIRHEPMHIGQLSWILKAEGKTFT